MKLVHLIKKWFLQTVESMVALMLVTMFFVFVLQVFSRYVMEESYGWTLEVCLTLWVWVVFLGNSFLVRHKDHITFDLLYHSLRANIQRLFSIIGALAIVVGMVISLYPTWDFINFLEIRKSAILHLPMNYVFSVYLIFMVMTIVIYVSRLFILARRGLLDDESIKHEEKEK